MTLSVGKQLTKQEAEDYYNRLNSSEFTDYRSKYGGCISSRPCMNCYKIISDSICLCINYFKCPDCGHINDNRVKIDDFKQI